MKREILDIDWDLIRSFEGFKAEGYVPQDTDGPIESGVTIASGFDIGQHTRTQIERYNFTPELYVKLVRYADKTGVEASNLLKETGGLTLHYKELNELDTKVREKYGHQVEKEYNENSDFTFCFLDKGKQTVIMSVAFQYGSLKGRCPKFFHCVTNGLWAKAVDELENFGDAYPTRRKKEAALLRSSLV